MEIFKLGIFLSALICASASMAQNSDSLAQEILVCSSESAARDIRIEACETAVIADQLEASERSVLLVFLGGLQFSEERYDKALESFQEAIRLDPESIVARDQKEALDRAAPEIFEQSPDELISFANGGLSRNPQDVALRHLRAIGFQKLGELEKALSDFDAAMHLARYPHLLRFERAKASWEAGRTDFAMRELEFLVSELGPEGPLVAEISTEIPKYNGYERIVRERWLAFVPTLRIDVLVYTFKASVTVEDFEAALAIVDLMRRLLPDEVEVAVERAEILEKFNRMDDALVEFNDAVRMSETLKSEVMEPDRRLALWKRGMFHARRASFDLAMNDFGLIFEFESSNQLEEVQEFLIEGGFYTGSVNGVYDADTEIALRLCLEDSLCLE